MSFESHFDIARVRKDFPMLGKTMHGKPLIYFDSAATAQKPETVINAVGDFYRDHYGTVHRAVYELSVYSSLAYQATREKARKFLNAAKSEEIIFTAGTTDAINLVAYSFGKAFVRPGDEIIITEMEHHSNIVPWQILCEDRGAVLRVVPIDEKGELRLDEFARMLNAKTSLVAVAHVSNSLGTINPIAAIVRAAHTAGAKVLVDGAQAAPHLPVDVQALDADFYVFSGHKVFGPTGIGILYGKEELLAVMPPYRGGGDMIEKVTFEKTTYNTLPLKFEAGTPMIAEVIGLGAALDYICTLGHDAILKQEHFLLSYATKAIEKIKKIRIIGTSDQKASLISFVVDGVHPLDIGTMLDLKGIAVRTGHLCAQPVMRRFGVGAMVRASFAFYNTKDEIDIFVEALRETIDLLSPD